MVLQFHDSTQAHAQNNVKYYEPFPVTNGVKQGCVVAPALFSMMFSSMLAGAFLETMMLISQFSTIPMLLSM